ncbi:hypothetical protein [Luteolibacter sp. LG18]|uniref:hypothetical protein n=1 Tax=Luteolibacter sp. LG18 TaxID=2819286 RepID=UPI002B29CEAE|nr:hypothetical protein llg_09610 [Luteolibacter sp. LG18]
MTSIPIAPRRRFVAGISAGWLVAMLPAVAALDGPARSGNLLILGWALGVVVLLITRRWERRLRKTFLPVLGHTPWCFRVSLLMAVVTSAFVFQAPVVKRYVPGAVLTHISGTLFLEVTEDGNSEVTQWQCGYEQFVRSGIAWSGKPKPTEEMVGFRFHPMDRPDASGWSLGDGEQFIREKGGMEVPISSAGMLMIFEDLGGPKVPSSLREPLLQRPWNELRIRRIFLTSFRCGPSPRPPDSDVIYWIDSQNEQKTTARWWPWSVCGAAWLVMVVVVHLITRLTFGSAK